MSLAFFFRKKCCFAERNMGENIYHLIFFYILYDALFLMRLRLLHLLNKIINSWYTTSSSGMISRVLPLIPQTQISTSYMTHYFPCTTWMLYIVVTFFFSFPLKILKYTLTYYSGKDSARRKYFKRILEKTCVLKCYISHFGCPSNKLPKIKNIFAFKY